MNPTDTVIVAGSLHYDIVVQADHLPRRDETATGKRWYPKFGGKGGNQAVAVARAGAKARMVGAVGDDQFGRYLREGLRSGGVDDRFVTTRPRTGSGMSVALVDPSGDYAATIVSGANLEIGGDVLEVDALWSGAGLLILQNEVPNEFNLAAARAARRRGIATLLNAAPARAIPEALCPLIDICVVNAVEAEMMTARRVRDRSSAAAAADDLVAKFNRVVVTCGGDGLAARSADGEAFTLPAEPATVVSTHGAGDAFVGAFAARSLGGASFREGCRAASQAAAAQVASGDPSARG